MLTPVSSKAGFTLAEVLITLGIIGVVAAMTVPTLIAKTRAKTLEAQFKKSYSVVTNATKLLIEQGISPYGLTPEERVVEYSRVLNATKKRFRWNESPNNLTGKDWAHTVMLMMSDVLVLKNGMMVIFSEGAPYYNWMVVDINGDKGPNMLGHDVHEFKFMPDDTLIPLQKGHDTRKCTLENKESKDRYLGYGCTYYAALNKNPDGVGDYWNDFLGQLR